MVAFVRLASYFLLLVHKKVTKVNDTPYHGLRLPCASRQSERLRNSGYALKQSSPKIPASAAMLGAAAGDLRSKPYEYRHCRSAIYCAKKLRDLKNRSYEVKISQIPSFQLRLESKQRTCLARL